MNFFEQQDKTQKATRKLFWYFGLAIFVISCLNYFLIQFYLSSSSTYTQISRMPAAAEGGAIPKLHFHWFDPKLFAICVLGTVFVILFVSWIKRFSLRKGGRSIAEMLGGTKISYESRDFHERRLINIVEEMALAAGIPVPDVFVLDEPSINAFAAGFTIDDAVIGVTKGCMTKLNRDELQGVIAHEYSHIFHGDMKINLNLISLLHGILFLHLAGRILLRSGSGHRRTRSRGKGSGGIMLWGLALMVIGYVGFIFGRVIQSAISRQREFLADASAVQYTRNPQGIAGALAKIGGVAGASEPNSILKHKKAEEVQHMMFSLSIAPGFMNLFATHPPIRERIQAIDPQFDYESVQPVETQFAQTSHIAAEGAMGFADPSWTPLAASSQSTQTSVSPVDHGGVPQEALLLQERNFLGKLDPDIYKACHHPQRAKALMYLLVLESLDNQNDASRLIEKYDPYLLSSFETLSKRIQTQHLEHRIELLDVSMPALRKLSKQEYKQFSKTLLALVKADQNVSLSEWIFVELVRSHLHAYFAPKEKSATISRESDLMESLRVLFSAVAYAGHDSQTDAQMAFDKGMSLFRKDHANMIDSGRLALKDIQQAFLKVKQASNPIKIKCLRALENIVLSDDQVTWEEYELYRALADGLGNPLPPLQKTS